LAGRRQQNPVGRVGSVVRRKRRDRTPLTNVPYGPRRPSLLDVVLWAVFVVVGLVPLILLVLAIAHGWLQGGDDASAFTSLVRFRADL
jgi:hypothetical protein